MDDEARAFLDELAATAADLGPALAPVGSLELLQSITDTARTIFNSAACSLALLDDGGEELTFFVASGAGADEVIGLKVPVGKGIAGWVVSSGQPISIADVTADPRFASGVAADTGYVPRSILAMPLETERRMIGAIEVLDRDASAANSASDMEILEAFARQAALAIESSRVFSDLGRELFMSLAEVVEEGDLRSALEAAAAHARKPDETLAALAAHFNELAHFGTREQGAATALVGQFLMYLKTRGSRP